MFDVPVSLSPSRVEAFTSCPMAFRFASIEKLPEPPGIHMTTRIAGAPRPRAVLHAARRRPHPARLDTALESALAEYRTDPDFTLLGLGTDEIVEFEHECHELIEQLPPHGGPHRCPRDRARVAPLGAGRRC